MRFPDPHWSALRGIVLVDAVARFYELAKELGITNENLVIIARRLGLDVLNHMSHVSEEDARRLRREVERTNPLGARSLSNPEIAHRRTSTPAVIHRRATSARGTTTPPEATTVQYFVDNLPLKIDDAEFARGLANLGRLSQARVLRQPRNGASLGCGYVTFAHEIAEAALREVRRWDRDLRVSRAKGGARPLITQAATVPALIRRDAASAAPTQGALEEAQELTGSRSTATATPF